MQRTEKTSGMLLKNKLTTKTDRIKLLLSKLAGRNLFVSVINLGPENVLNINMLKVYSGVA